MKDVCPSCGCSAVNLVVEWTSTVQLGDEYLVEAQIIEARCKECGLEVPLSYDRITITGDGEAPM